mgnify:CR=1 FL=1
MSQQNQKPVIAAIDLGYGFTKFSVLANGKSTEDSFPSFTPTASGSHGLGASSALSKLRVVPVEVNNKKYLVGVDSVMASDGRLERHRDPAYCTTDAYDALTFTPPSSNAVLNACKSLPNFRSSMSRSVECGNFSSIPAAGCIALY